MQTLKIVKMSKQGHLKQALCVDETKTFCTYDQTETASGKVLTLLVKLHLISNACK